MDQDTHKSVSAYVAFDIVETKGAEASADLSALGRVAVVVWTTTPWTIPANVAVAVNATFDYVVVAAPSGARAAHWIVAECRLGALAGVLFGGGATPPRILLRVSGARVAGAVVAHPLLSRTSLVISASHVGGESGTGCVWWCWWWWWWW